MMRPISVGFAVLFAFFLSSFETLAQPSINTSNTYVSGRMMRNNVLTINYGFNAAVVGSDVSIIEWYSTTNFLSTPVFPGAVGTTSGSATKIASGTSKLLTLNSATVNRFIYCTITPIDGSGTGATHTEIPWQEPGVGGASGTASDIAQYAVLNNSLACSGSNATFFQEGNSKVCSGNAVTIENIGARDIRFSNSQEVYLIMNWGDGTAAQEIKAELLNPRETSVFFQEWGKRDNNFTAAFEGISHTYNASNAPSPVVANRLCTYAYTLTGLAVRNISTNALENTCNLNLANPAVIWDTEDNARIGTFDAGKFDGVGNEPVGQPLVLEICENNTGNFRLEDESDFNCTPNFETGATSQNNQSRWVQWVYGETGSTVSAVTIDGVTYTNAQFPIYGAIEYLPATVVNPNSITPQMSLPVDAVTGQTLKVRLRSWNICNAYDIFEFDGGANEDDDGTSNVRTGTPLTGVTAAQTRNADNAPKSIIFNVNVVDRPAALTTSGLTVCYSTTNSTAFNFTVASSVAGRSGVNWYNKNPRNGGATLMTNSLGTNSLTFPASDYTAAKGAVGGNFSITNINGAYYSVWATQVVAGTNTCESDPVEVVIIQQPRITNDVPNQPTGLTSVCNSSSVVYTTSSTPPTKTISATTFANTSAINLPTEHLWSHGFGAGTSLTPTTGNSTTVTFGVSPQPNPSVTNNVSVRLRYQTTTISIVSPLPSPITLPTYTITTQSCQNNNVNRSVTVFGESNGGSITPVSQTICEGASIATISLTNTPVARIGSVLGWEKNVNNSGWVPDGTLGASTSITPLVPLIGGVTTNYKFRAVVQNSPCNTATSAVAEIIVNPRAVSAVLTGDATICQGNSSNLVVSITGGVSPFSVTYTDGVTPVTVNGYISGTNIPVTPASTKTYSLVSVQDANSCAPLSLSGSATVTVSNPTSAVIDGDINICPLQSADFNVVITGGVGPYTLRYRINGGAPITVNNYTSGSNIPTGALASGTYTYTIEDVRDQNNCLSLSNTGSAVIVVGSSPASATFSGGGSVCLNGSKNLVLTIVGGTAPYTVTITPSSGPAINYIGNYISGTNIPVPTSSTGSIDYAVTFVSDACGSPLVGTVTGSPQTVVVNPLPVVVNQTPVVCSNTSGGTTATVDLTSQNTLIHPTATITWFTAYNSGSGVFSGPIATPAAYTVTHNTPVFARVQDGNSCVSAATVTYTVRPKATITMNPAAAAICDLGSASFSVAASGNDLAIRWQENAGGGFVDIADGGIYSGATTNTLTITGAPLGMNGRLYRANVTSFSSSSPSCPVASNQATLTVNAYPGISSQPVPAAQCVGLNTSFTATATGTAITRKWQVSPDGLAPFVDISDGPAGGGLVYGGSATNTLTLTGVTTAVNGYHYRLRVTRATSCEIFSNDATLTVNVLPTVNVITPVLCDDVAGGALVVGAVTLSAYDALVTNAASVTWYDDAARSNVVTTPSVTNGQTFYWKGTSGASCTNVGQVTFTVEDLPDAVDKTYAFCEDGVNAGVASNINLTLLEFGVGSVTDNDGNATNRNVIWYTDAGLTSPVDDPGTPAFNEETDFSINMTTTLYANVINTSSAAVVACSDVAQVTLVYKPKPINNPISGDATLCSSNDVKVYQVNPALNLFGSIHQYEWTVTGTANFEVFQAGTGFTVSNNYTTTTTDFLIIVKFPNPGSFTISAKEIIDGCDGNVSTRNVSVTGAPAALAINGLTQVCKDQTGVTYSLSTPPNAGSVYTWTVIGGTVVGATSGTGLGTITVNWGSFTLPQPSVSVTETNSNGCSGTPASINITLNDVPTITSSATTTICSGSTPNSIVPFTADIGGASCTSCSFEWKIVNATANVTIGGLPVPVFPAPGSTGTGPIPQVLLNSSGINGTVFYEVIAYEGDSPTPPTCGSAMQPFTVTVLPEPVVNTISNIEVCSGQPISAINFSGNAGGETFNWANDNISIGLISGSTGNIGGFNAAINTNATDIVANITVTATKNGCTSSGANSKTFTITIKPEPVYNAATPIVCSDDAIGLNFTSLKAGLGISATSFNITNIVSNGLTASAGAPSTGTGFAASVIADDRWTNTTANPVNVVYTVVPVAGNCLGNSFLVTVTVNPEPVYANSTAIICSDDAVGINFTSLKAGTSVAASTFDISSIVSNGLTASAGSPSVANGLTALEIADDRWTNTTANPVNVIYTVTPMNGSCAGTSFTVTVTVNPEPVYAGINPTRCSDEIIGIDLSTLKSGSGVNATAFNVTAINANGLTASAGSPTAANGVGALEISNDSWTNTTANPVNVIYTITPLNGSCAGTSFDVTVTINPEPVYANETSTRCSYDALGVNLNTLQTGGVTATSFNITNIVTNGLTSLAGSPATGNGLSNLEIADDVWRNTTSAPVSVIYTITPVNGSCAGTPFTVSIAITPDPVYSNGTPTVCSDDAVNINLNSLKAVTSVTATGFNITNITANGLTASAGNPAVANGVAANDLLDDRWTNTTAAPVNVVYAITPLNGSCPGIPFNVTVTVNPEPVYIDINPTRCSDEVTGIDLSTLKAGAGVNASSFNITSIVSNGLVASAGSPSVANGVGALEISNDSWNNTNATPVDVVYTIVPLNGSCAGSPFTVTITVNPEPVYTNATPSRCSDEVVALDLSTLKAGTGIDATSYDILTITTNGLTASAGSPAIGNGLGPLEIANDAWTNLTANPVNVVYSILPKSGSCPGTAFTVTVTVAPEPVYNSANPVVCSDELLNLNLLSLKAGTSVTATSFNITNITTNGLTASAGSPAVSNGVSASNLANDSWTNTTSNPVDVVYTIIPLNGACQGTAFTVTVTVNPEPVYDPATATVCSDDVVGLDLSSLKNGTGISATGFNITNIATNGLTASAGNPATGINLNALVITDDRWTNTTANPVNVDYTIVPVAGTCQGTPFVVSVSVTPEPVYNNATITKCSDEQLSLDLSTLQGVGNVVATAFNIVSINNNGLTASAGSPSVTSGVSASEISDDRWTNTSLIPVNVVYTVVPVNGSCQGSSFTVTVTVNPEPVGATTTFVKCSGETFNVNLVSVMSAGSVLPSTYTIAINANGLTFAGSSNSQGSGKTSSELLDDKWTNTTSNPVDVVYQITPVSASNCPGEMFTLTFTINPRPVAPLNTFEQICSDGTFNLDLQSVVDNVAGGGNEVESVFAYSVISGNPLVSPAGPRNVASDAAISDTYENRSNSDALITYTVTPTSDLGCVGSTFLVKLTVHPEPVGISLTEPKCITNLNENIQLKHINVTGGNSLPSIFSYTVLSSNQAQVPAGADRVTANALNITDSYSNTSGADVTITYTITPFNSAHPTCAGTPFTYAVTISSKPVGVDGAATTVCSDIPFSINPQGNITNGVTSTFTWNASYDPGLTGPANGSGNAITGTLTNNTTGIKNAYFDIIPSSGSCAGNLFRITQPINPEPIIDPSVTPRTVCSDVVTGIVFSALAGTETPDRYDISLLSQDPGLTGTPTTGTALSANAIQNNSFTNRASSQSLLVKYQVTPYGPSGLGGCQGDNLIVQLEVLPEPVMLPSLANVSICSDVANGIEFATDGISAAATNYFVNAITLKSNGAAILPNTTVVDVTSKIGNSTADALIARTKAFIKDDKFTVTKGNGIINDRTVVYNVTPRSAAGCLGDAFNVNLLVLPEPTFDPLAPPPVCSDQLINLQLLQRDPTSPQIAQYNVSGVTFQSGLVAGGGNTLIGVTLAADGNGDYISINDKYTNPTASTLTATYSVKPVAVAVLGQSCEGDVVPAIVTIRPSPAIEDNLDKIVCNDATNGINVVTKPSSAPAQSFKVVRTALSPSLTSTTYAAGASTPNGASTNIFATDKFINASTTPVVVTYKVTAFTDPNADLPGAIGCPGPEKTITVTVEPQILVDNLIGNNLKKNICSADQSEIVLSSLSTPSAGNVTFNFTSSASVAGAVSGAVPGSNLQVGDEIQQILSNSTANAVDVTYTVTPRANSAAGGNGCIGTPASTVVKVEPKPRMSLSPASLTVCEGVPLGIDINSVTNPSTGAGAMFFKLTGVDDANDPSPAAPTNVSGFVTSFPTNYLAGADRLNDVLTNSAVGQEAIRYHFVPAFTIPSATCEGDPVSLNITVSPRPVMVPFTVDPSCSGDPFSFDFSSFVTQVDLNSTLSTWTFSYSPAGNPNISGASNGAGYELSQVVNNKTADMATVNYAIKAKSFGCESNTIIVPVEIYPVPKINGVPRSVDVCNNGALSIPLTTNVSNSKFTWSVDDELQPTLAGAADQSTAVSGPMSYTLSNSGSALASYTFEITPQVETALPGKVCPGNPHSMIVNVAPPSSGEIAIRSTGTQESFICQGTKDAVEFQFEGLLLFDVTYKVGGTTVNLTRQSQRVAIPVEPSATTQYELVSIKDGYGCVTNINKTATITVFRKVDAVFNEGVIPPFVAGSSNVTFTNTSTPLDGSEFRYEWSFGANANPQTFTGADVSVPVTYSLPGLKDVVLTATNTAAEAKGVTCSDTYRKTIEIILPPLIAAFQINPLAACFPVDLEVTSNTSTGDTFNWQVIDQSGNIAATAQAPKPIFRIVNPGTYDVFLETSSSITGQKAFSQVNGIEVYDNPVASLEARPITLFIPDTELTTFNFSTGANFYNWDFGDGATADETEPKHFYTLEGTYDIVLVAGFDHGDKDIDGDGLLDGNVVCYDTATRQVIAKEGGLTKVPNAFTPNKNGPTGGVPGNGTFNDTFLPITKGVAREDGAFVMQIFDRWGTLVFESRNQNVGWDGYDRNGNLVPAGVYVYKLDLRLADGQRTTQIGDVTVIR